ncbi:MAG TPA: ferredoxin [Coriobacteriia bacterium]|nr:ferredoxin [Coriobacteriia bacterium]
MKAVVDRDLCIGCGLCEEICPEVFRMGDDGIAYVLDENPPAETYPDVRDAVESCPVTAISIAAEEILP